MTLGFSNSFNILKQSPLDANPSPPPTAPAAPEANQWVPSRFNVRARTEDGGLVVWNTFRGTMSVFGPEQREAVEAMLSRNGFTGCKEGAVKYLFDRGFLVASGTDEYRRLRLAFGQQHYRSDTLELILLTSEDCNFRCTYCYEDFNRGTMEPWVREGVKKLVEKRAPTLRRLQTSYFGGEPLYGLEAIEDLAPFFVEMAERHSLSFGAGMTTNGYLLTPEVAQKLFSWRIKSFQITLDGPPEAHDRSRPARDGGGTFAVIHENLRELKKLDEQFLVDLRVNFDRDNRPYLPRLLALLEEDFGNDSRFKLRFRAVGQWGGPNDAKLNVCGGDEADRVIFELKEEARRLGLKLADEVRTVQGVGAQICYAARPYNYIVGANGNLMKCTVDLDKKDRNIVGQITADGNLQLDQDKFAMWTEPAFESDKKCQKCVVLPVCQGMFCPQIRFDYNRSPCTPLRLGAKRELRASWADTAGRKRTVATTPGSLSPPDSNGAQAIAPSA